MKKLLQMLVCCWLFLTMMISPVQAANVPIKITLGSKTFTESVILGEMLLLIVKHVGMDFEYKRQLGGTRILWGALLSGEIDAYPEYTGTLLQEILVKENIRTEAQLKQALANLGLRMTLPLGFNNTYALGMKATLAQKLKLRTISDLKNHPELKMGFSSEFMDRADGWPGLQQRYQLPQQHVRGLEHDLAYRGIASDSIHVIDLYATDAEIAYYKLQSLDDDLRYFPTYNAIILYRVDLEQRAPQVVDLFNRLSGQLDALTMSSLNAKVKIQGESDSKVAADFLKQSLNLEVDFQVNTVADRFWKHTGEHFVLVSISLISAILVAIPLGILAARRRRLGQIILGVAGVIQTIPTLALFVFMIPLLGIGGAPAIVTLFLYSLLPIIRNTHTGLKEISPAILESAQAIGLSSRASLRIVELPLAMRTILAGIKTSAVINVGTATLGALIGAGGYGQPILTGIRLDDTSLILQGAIPAAVLALLVQGLFELAERSLLPGKIKVPELKHDSVN